MRFWLKIPPVFLLVAATGWLIRLALEQSWSHLVDQCPNTDVLLWDANLRLLTVLDQYQDFRDGQFLRALAPLFDAPTWPPLRNVFSLVLFALHPAGPGTLLDVSISFVFYLLVFPSILVIAFELTRDWLRAAVIFSFASVLLIQSRFLPVFGVSAMLETQGMFFMLWTLFFLHKVYEHHEFREASIGVRERRELPGKRRFVWGLFVFSQALFHTKYPYGVMLILALVALEFARNPGQWVDLVALLFSQHYGGRRWWHYLLNGLKILAVLVFAVAILTRGETSNKTVKYALYALTLIFFVDLQIYLAAYRHALSRMIDRVSAQIYIAVVLPSAAWMLLHPDRVSSILGTQQHVQDASRSFFYSIFTDVFDDARPFAVVLAGAAAACTVVLVRALFSGTPDADGGSAENRTSVSQRIRETLGRPLIAVSAALLLQYVILEILTGNKQLRHIYHLLPAILMLIGAWFVRLPRLIPKSWSPGRLPVRRIMVAVTLALPLVLVLPVLRGPGGLLAAPGTENVEYLARRPMCFTGTARELYEPVRWFSLRIDPGRRYILVNTFHELATPPHARQLATEFDLLLRMRALSKGTVRNDSRYTWKTWEGFENVLQLTVQCPDPVHDALLKDRASNVGADLDLVATHRYEISGAPAQEQGGGLCLREYRIRPAEPVGP